MRNSIISDREYHDHEYGFGMETEDRRVVVHAITPRKRDIFKIFRGKYKTQVMVIDHTLETRYDLAEIFIEDRSTWDAKLKFTQVVGQMPLPQDQREKIAAFSERLYHEGRHPFHREPLMAKDRDIYPVEKDGSLHVTSDSITKETDD